MDNTKEVEAAIRLSRMKGVGAAGFKQLLSDYKLPTTALKEWLLVKPDERKLLEVSKGKNSGEEMIEYSLKKLSEEKYYAYYYSQKGYPEQLCDLGEPPPVIFSTARLQKHKYAAVVGSRHTSEEKQEYARQITKELMKQGFVIVSGGAAGIDTIALQTAVENNGYAMAILANGLDVTYPKENRELFKEICRHGALITELMFGAQPQKGFFPTRNRLISAISDVVVAIPSSETSGSLITASWASKLNRKVTIHN